MYMKNLAFENVWQILKTHDLQTDEEIDKEFICTICTKIMIKACNGPCGCRYCWECINVYLDGEKKVCPGSHHFCQDSKINPEKNLEIDRAINIRISRMLVKCPHSSCDTRIELIKLEDHIILCEHRPIVCPFLNIGCCDNQMAQSQVRGHLLEQNHTHADLLIKCITILKQEIESIKQNVLELNKQNEKLKEEVRTIMASEDTKQIELLKLNITDKFKEAEIEQLKTDIIALRSENKSQKVELENIKINDKRKQMEFLELKTISNRQTQQLDQMSERCQTLEKSSDISNNIQEELMDKVTKFIVKSSQINRSVIVNDGKVEQLESKIFEIEINTEIHRYGEFVWIIDKFSEKRRQAMDGSNPGIGSAPFYSHKNGYKMCLVVYPNGNTSGKGMYLSILFCLARGAFDDTLRWPFKHHVTLSLINQQTGLNHVSETIKYEELPNSVDWEKPTSERNGAFGKNFITICELLNNPALNKNDQICIKCRVDRSTVRR